MARRSRSYYQLDQQAWVRPRWRVDGCFICKKNVSIRKVWYAVVSQHIMAPTIKGAGILATIKHMLNPSKLTNMVIAAKCFLANPLKSLRNFETKMM